MTPLATRNTDTTAAPADGRAGKYLTFDLAGEEFGVRVLKVREIMGLQEITPVPQTAPHVRGVINLRGKVNEEAEVLKRAFSFEELDAMDRRMKAARNGKVIEAPAVSKDTHTSGEVEGGVTPSQAPGSARPPSSWRD